MHLTALAEHCAQDAVARACDIASAHVQRLCNDIEDCHKNARSGTPLYGTGYWRTYPKAPRGQAAAEWTPAWWDWNLKKDDWASEDSRDGVPVFITGACVDRTVSYFGGADGAACTTKLSDDDHGFVAFSNDSHDRVARVAYPRRRCC